MMDYASRDTAERFQVRRQRIALSVGLEVVWMILSVVLIVLLTGALSALVGDVGAATPLAALLLLFAIAILGRAIRRKRGILAVNYLEQAVRQNLPIPLMLDAAEQAETAAMRWRLGLLRARIEHGMPISGALATAMPGIAPRSLGLIESGERLGQLAPVLSRLVRPASREVDDRDPAQMIYLRWYPLAMLLALTVVATLLLALVLPKYEDIFRDFGLPLPRLTLLVLNAYDHFAFPFMIAIILILAISCGRALASVITIPGPPFSMWKWLTDRLAWVMPVWRGVTRNRGLADVCHIVGDALEIGQPLDISLLEAADACTNLVLHRRVVKWGREVTSGSPLDEVARRAKMPALVANLLRTAHGPDGARDVFRFLARYYETRHSSAASFMAGAAVPLMVGVFGCAVAVLALAMFLPLIALINHLPVTGKLL